jgi:ribosomal-protein-alanine N-acetyltransferase
MLYAASVCGYCTRIALRWDRAFSTASSAEALCIIRGVRIDPEAVSGGTMELALQKCVVRSYRPSDAESLAAQADNRRIWQNLRDGFPHPYRVEDARAFIARAVSAVPETMFAIGVDGAAVGGIGFTLQSDIERISAEIGYWLGEPFWGKGIAAEAVRAVTKYAIETHGLKRVYAVPFEANKASQRVLEKAGYVPEGRMISSAVKDGQVINQMLYAFTV